MTDSNAKNIANKIHDDLHELCVFPNKKRMWLFFFSYIFQKKELMRLPFVWKQFGSKKKIRFSVHEKNMIVFQRALKRFEEKEGKWNDMKIGKLMTFDNISKGLIAHYTSVGLTEKAKDVEARWKTNKAAQSERHKNKLRPGAKRPKLGKQPAPKRI